MPFRQRSHGIEILTADGRFTTVDGRTSARPVILLARDLCAFEHHRPHPRSTSAILAEGRLHAERAAPFLNSGCLVRRQGAGVSIWWWDLDLVQPWLRERFDQVRVRVLPLSLAQPPGDGWRIVSLDRGYEAQLWGEGAMIASVWSPDMYDRKSWSAFTRLQRRTVAAQDPPTPVKLPIVGARIRMAQLPDLTIRDILRAALMTCAIGLLLLSVFSLGQAARLNGEAKVLAANAPVSVRAGPTADTADRQRLQAYRALSQRPDPVAALATALGVVERYGVDPKAYAADTERVRLTLPYDAISSLDRIAVDLRESGLFTEVRTTTDEAGETIDLSLTLAPAAR